MEKRRILGIIISICLLLEGCGAGNENTDVSIQESHQEEAAAEEATLPDVSYTMAYQRFLDTYMEENEYAYMTRITLAFIDVDDVPELLLIEDNGHASGVKVYTYYQELVIELGEFGSFGSMQYVENGGMIFSGYSGMGEGVSQFFQVENGEAKLVCSMIDYQPLDGGSESYEIDGVNVTEDAFQKKWEEMYDADEYVVIRYEDALPIRESELVDVRNGSTQKINNF